MLNLKAETPNNLEEIARQIIAGFEHKRIFALYGAMGAGKTTLIKALCRVLGVRDKVVSPTFSLINEYINAEGEPVFHFDFYRIKAVSEAFDMGYEEYFYSGHYCFVEWPENIEQLLPPGFVYINIQVGDGSQTRIINVR
ncbi:MAG TPA: tRNA (adenosine(37)-N6)-threonylcarbamoyltransferase complex ATPase subunit type 1 TsaE [Bacteroidales bacterium]|nr:tRNA (adenosine(37)-N6)-threonylcarbamoyltransferase complex ATPase subunit type 1 TsaE [Bacteroidales bacterium]